jgi:hypothetical protein
MLLINSDWTQAGALQQRQQQWAGANDSALQVCIAIDILIVKSFFVNIQCSTSGICRNMESKHHTIIPDGRDFALRLLQGSPLLLLLLLLQVWWRLLLLTLPAPTLMWELCTPCTWTWQI